MIHTHSFNGTKYKIDFVDAIDGATDVIEKAGGLLEMAILTGNDFRAFHSAFHESLEASGFCDSCMHFKDGTPATIDAAKFLWRWLKENKWQK